jgi:crotonobetaine/carnitine-CoA ligase
VTRALDRTIPALLRAAADRQGDHPCLTVDPVRLDYAGVHDAAGTFAGILATLGIQAGDRVAVMSENCFEVLGLWLGCAWRGAVLVPLNTAARGAQLEHMLSNAAPKVLVIEPELRERLEALSAVPEELERLLQLGDSSSRPWRGIPTSSFPEAADPVEAAPVRPGDTLAILYTSGTTGVSKGVMCPHAQFAWWGEVVGGMLELGDEDTLYTCLPLFHTNALNAFAQALTHGAHLVVGPRFSASRFWERITEAQATVTYLLGAMVTILSSQEASSFDRAHRVRVALAPATPAGIWGSFEQRFGVRLVEGHGMTETNAVIGPRDGEQRPGWMGRCMPGFDARVVDEDDEEVPFGTPGELIVRAEHPFAFATGYWRMPEATVQAWRNLWFHSGDRVVRDADGYFRFLDRLHDAIRRRGENVSAWEVEQVLVHHPHVEAAAVVPVPSELGEDDVMAFVVPSSGRTIDPVELIRFCEPRLAYFAIPRYVDVVAELPLTENGKVRKFLLRERGVTSTTWDRERAGVEVRR